MNNTAKGVKEMVNHFSTLFHLSLFSLLLLTPLLLAGCGYKGEIKWQETPSHPDLKVVEINGSLTLPPPRSPLH
jgi:hypothetical protein